MPNMIHTCLYWNYKYHTSNVVYIQNFGIPNGNNAWVEKETNPNEPKEYWEPENNYWL